VIKSVKIVEGRMVQGHHHRYVFTAATTEDRDDWVEALQKESPAPPPELAKYKSPSMADRRTPTAGINGKSPRSSTTDLVNRPLAEGWLKRRSDVNHTWQRRYFMLVAQEKKRGEKKTGLYYYTTQEMGNRMIELGVSTQQGVIPITSIKKVRVVLPGKLKA